MSIALALFIASAASNDFSRSNELLSAANKEAKANAAGTAAGAADAATPGDDAELDCSALLVLNASNIVSQLESHTVRAHTWPRRVFWV